MAYSLDSIRKDFTGLFKMLGDRRTASDNLEQAFRGFAYGIVRYQLQDETKEDRDRAWTLLETMCLQYDAVMGYRAGQDIIDMIKNTHT